MGGLMFIIGIGIAILILGWRGMLENFTHLYVYVFALVFGVIGYIDDYQKVKHHHNTGLTAPRSSCFSWRRPLPSCVSCGTRAC